MSSENCFCRRDMTSTKAKSWLRNRSTPEPSCLARHMGHSGMDYANATHYAATIGPCVQCSKRSGAVFSVDWQKYGAEMFELLFR